MLTNNKTYYLIYLCYTETRTYTIKINKLINTTITQFLSDFYNIKQKTLIYAMNKGLIPNCTKNDKLLNF